jgi:putative membrane protein
MGYGMISGMLLFWIVLIVVGVLLVRVLFQTNQTKIANLSPSARQILEIRFARGEITQEQYLLMLKDIQ